MTQRVLRWLVVTAFIVAALRFVFVVSTSESGWDFVRTEWQNTLLAPFGFDHTPVGDASPSEQIEFWLREVDRVVGTNPDSASLAMGGAWMLDSPERGFLKDSTLESSLAALAPQLGPSFDKEMIAREKAIFQRRAATEIRHLAKQATDLEPHDVRWWRMRALLLFEADTLFTDQQFRARGFDTLEVLAECKRHDPENALYDYLAALELWRTSAKYEYPPYDADADAEGSEDPSGVSGISDNDRWILTVDDAERFMLGVDHFEAAQKLPTIAIGEAGNSSIAEFLEETSLRKLDQAEVATSRLLTFRFSTVFLNLWRWQEALADEAYRAGKPDEELRLLRQRLRMFDQAIAPKETSALEVLVKLDSLRQSTFQHVESLATGDPALIGGDALAAMREREEGLRLDSAVLLAALQTMQSKPHRRPRAGMWPCLLSSVVARLTLLASLVAVAAVLGQWLLSRDAYSGLRLHAPSCFLAWSVAWGLTFVVLGLAPAEIIPPLAQHIVVTASFWLVVALAVAMAVVRVVRNRRRHPRFQMRSLLVLTTLAAVAAAAWAYFAPAIERFIHDPPEMVIPARGLGGSEADVLRVATNISPRSWEWASLQWILYHGPSIALGLSLALGAFLTMWHWARAAQAGVITFWSQNLRPRWGGLANTLAKSAATATLCWLFVYFCLAPTATRYIEATFQDEMRYYRNLPAHLTEIEEARLAILSTPSEIDAIREQVQFEMSDKDLMKEEFPAN